MYSSLFYNIHVAASTTTQGKSCISAAILLFESFLANNVEFGSVNEVVTFIHNVITEKRVYDDKLILDRDISKEECFFHIMSTCGFYWVPTEEEMETVWDIINGLSQENINRLFYKNNLYHFCDNKSITTAITYILQKLDKPFLDPNKPPKEIKVELDELLDLMKEYVYYGYQYIDRIDRTENMIRKISIITDTDSSMVSFDAWYRYILDKVYHIDMPIKHELISPIEYVTGDEFDSESLEVTKYVEPVFDYDFYRDELVEVQRMINPIEIIPQDNLRYSIINIMAYIVGKLVVDYMERYSMNSNSYADNRKCLLVLKNEFLFRRILNTNGKKNYANIQEVQEGNMVPKDKSLHVMGMPIDKSTLQKSTRERLKKILYEDILTAEDIDQVRVLKSVAKFEKEIYNNLSSGKKDYYKPVSIKSIASYENPMRIVGIKAAIVYNALRDPGAEAIDLEKRNSIDIVKVDINPKNIDSIREEDEERYNKLVELMKIKEFELGITGFGLPMNEEIPKWVIPFIDYTSIINDNVKNFPFESIGISRFENSNVNYTNILKL